MKIAPPSIASTFKPYPSLMAFILLSAALSLIARGTLASREGPAATGSFLMGGLARGTTGGARAETGAVLTVANANDSGTGSLRQAIADANANPGPDVIIFDIPGTGPHTIATLSPLPAITGPVEIDGYTQPGARPNALVDADDAILLIELNGAAAGAGVNGLTITGGSSPIRGLKVTGFSFSGIRIGGAGGNRIEGNFIVGNSTRGVEINAGAPGNTIGGPTPAARNIISSNGSQGVRILAGSPDNVIQGNFIGVDATGIGAAGNFNEGVFISSSNNVVGGAGAGARNIISASQNTSGLAIAGTGVMGNTVDGNRIGTDATGTGALGNRQEGILIDGASNNAITGNLISGNTQNGIVLGFSSPANGNQIFGNLIGTRADGVSPLGNGQDGIALSSGSNNLIGNASGGGNVIAFNANNGVEVLSGTGNAILTNSIFSNGGLGIDLGADGVTPNDFCDPDAGANGIQNFPVLTAAMSDQSGIRIQGMIDSTPNTSFVIQFFSNTACDATGFGEGATFIGSTTVATGVFCNASFSVTFPSTSPAAAITATATDAQGNTSEFSPCLTANECTITCPPDVILPIPETAARCGSNVTYAPPVPGGNCAAVICSPPSGSFFPLGTTTVTCSETASTSSAAATASAICSFKVTVVDSTPPTLTCPANINEVLEPTQLSKAVAYPTPLVTDNCPGSTSVNCVPPPGARFSPGTTTVNCRAIDSSGNISTCDFTVSIIDPRPPGIACSTNVVAQAASGQCQALVEYAAPNISGSPAGTTAACQPPSGSNFPVGVTTVTCVGASPAGSAVRCSFIVTVNGLIQPRLILEDNAEALEFGPAEPRRKSKNRSPAGCDCVKTFVIENPSCSVLNLNSPSILRTGSDVETGKVSDPDDSRLFSVRVLNPDGTERPVQCQVGSACVRIDPGQRVTFRVSFNPIIPNRFAGRTNNLAASDLLPDLITSKISFTRSGGPPVMIDLIGRVSTRVLLVNPDRPRGPKRVELVQSDNEFIVTFGVFDSNLDVRRARYEFFDGQQRQVGRAIEVDLAQMIGSNGINKGHAFLVVQRFTGARDNGEVTRVRVTVFDAESSDSASSP